MGAIRWIPVVALLHLAATSRAETYEADVVTYRDVLRTLAPGDTLLLAPGDYARGLEIAGLHGAPDKWIVIRGPESGPPARFLGDRSASTNTIEIRSASYLALENLVIDGQGIDGIFGISAKGGPCHHVRIENCMIVGHGAHQGTVAVSTKVTTWGWVIRRNRIVAPGCGLYLGDSDGRHPFIGGLIEYNLFLDAKGYNAQIKHQRPRDETIPGIPKTPQRTIIRHNVFLKGELPNEDGPRPNLLVGAFPESGLGSEDMYEIYGNLFVHNHRESLLQADGRVTIHDNVFVDGTGNGIRFQNHYGKVRVAYAYHNTFYEVAQAIHFAHPALDDHLVAGNLMFSREGVTGAFRNARDNVHDAAEKAGDYVRRPSLVLGEMDFHPLPGKCAGPPLDLAFRSGDTDYDRDFDGAPKGDFTFRGAYAGGGPGWPLAQAIKGEVPSTPPGGDKVPPTGTVLVAKGDATTTSLVVTLDLSATDGESVMGAGSLMCFSNNGAAWSPPEPYAATRLGWDLSKYGGNAAPGPKAVYARFRDAAGNWSTAVVMDSIEYLAGE